MVKNYGKNGLFYTHKYVFRLKREKMSEEVQEEDLKLDGVSR